MAEVEVSVDGRSPISMSGPNPRRFLIEDEDVADKLSRSLLTVAECLSSRLAMTNFSSSNDDVDNSGHGSDEDNTFALLERVKNLVANREWQEAHHLLYVALERDEDIAFDKDMVDCYSELIISMSDRNVDCTLIDLLLETKNQMNTAVTTPMTTTKDVTSVLDDEGTPIQSPPVQSPPAQVRILRRDYFDKDDTNSDSGGESRVHFRHWRRRSGTATPLLPLKPRLPPNLDPDTIKSDIIFPCLDDDYVSVSSRTTDTFTLMTDDDTLTWKLFQRLVQSGFVLSHDAHMAFSKRLCERRDFGKALGVLDMLPKRLWSTESYKLAILIHLHKKPQDVEAAKSILQEATKDDPVSEKSQILFLCFASCLKNAKWTDCVEQYEIAKLNAVDHHHTYLDDAMLELCLTYEEYEYGWEIFERIKDDDIEKYSLGLAMTVCWKAFYSTNSKLDPNNARTWEARSWAVYNHVLNAKLKQNRTSVLKYVGQRLLDVVRESPDVDSRPAKIDRVMAVLDQLS